MPPSLHQRPATPIDEHRLLLGRPLFAPDSLSPRVRDRYRFIDYPDGFRIEPSAGTAVTVRLEPWAFVVTNEASDNRRINLLCPLLRLTHQVAAMIRSTGRGEAAARTIRTWKIAPGVAAQRERLLARVNPTILAVQRTISELCGKVVPAAQSEALFRDPYVSGDVLRYPAATIALAYIESDLWEHFCAYHLRRTAPPSPELAAEAMRNWRGLFAPAGVPYRSLNRTLMNLSRSVPPRLVCQLNRVRLERPIFDPLELTTLLLHVATTPATSDPEVRTSQRRILLHATADQIRRAVARVGAATERELNPYRRQDLVFALTYLGDYPEPYCATIDGLAERAIRWHREAALRAQHQQLLDQLGGAARHTKRPPVPLPTTEGITFLSTVGQVLAEGRRMENCIATYAHAAVAGKSFLFHIERGSEMASVEVDPRGLVRQGAGPRNCHNAAATWGRIHLAAWGRGFTGPRKPARPRRRADPSQLTFAFA